VKEHQKRKKNSKMFFLNSLGKSVELSLWLVAGGISLLFLALKGLGWAGGA
jgi:hypothetical protein